MKTTLKIASLLVMVTSLVSINLKAQTAFSNDLLITSSVLDRGLTPSETLTEFNSQTFLKVDVKESRLFETSSQRSAKGQKWSRNFDLDRYYPRRGTENFFNIYLGLNNWLEDGDLPNSDQPYSLIPINSWYLGLNFDNVTHILGPVYLDWGIGASFQDFSFENTRIQLVKEDDAILFQEVAGITGRKSEINAGYLNVHFVPTFSFGRYRDFRVGFGVYGGYRIRSNTKMKFDDGNGETQKDKFNDSFHINPFKYGFRGTVGWDFFDLFFNYDLTEFFDEDVNAPRLTPVTFGIIF